MLIAHRGLKEIPAAQDRLQSGQSMGKVIVQLSVDLPPSVSGTAAKL